MPERGSPLRVFRRQRRSCGIRPAVRLVYCCETDNERIWHHVSLFGASARKENFSRESLVCACIIFRVCTRTRTRTCTRTHSNGEREFPGRAVVCDPRYAKNFEALLDQMTGELRPVFGTVRRLFLVEEDGSYKRISSLGQLLPNAIYIATGLEPLHKLDYRVPPEFLPTAESRAVSALGSTLKFGVIANGENESVIKRVSVSVSRVPSWDQVLDDISGRLNLVGKAHWVFDSEGQEVKSVSELQQNHTYIVADSLPLKVPKVLRAAPISSAAKNERLPMISPDSASTIRGRSSDSKTRRRTGSAGSVSSLPSIGASSASNDSSARERTPEWENAGSEQLPMTAPPPRRITSEHIALPTVLDEEVGEDDEEGDDEDAAFSGPVAAAAAAAGARGLASAREKDGRNGYYGSSTLGRSSGGGEDTLSLRKTVSLRGLEERHSRPVSATASAYLMRVAEAHAHAHALTHGQTVRAPSRGSGGTGSLASEMRLTASFHTRSQAPREEEPGHEQSHPPPPPPRCPVWVAAGRGRHATRCRGAAGQTAAHSNRAGAKPVFVLPARPLLFASFGARLEWTRRLKSQQCHALAMKAC
eukprot:m.270933 g.270933  ORF g.270933 m.270933 type:complete len:589 (-) comp22832_c6_seq10:898-2664(-)